MKKILFASTALVATAGLASAEVSGSGAGTINITGLAEMGIFDNGNDDTQFFTDIDVVFAMTGEADNGLTFGGTVDLDENPAGFSAPGTQGGETLFVAFGGVRLTMGDTNGALDQAVPEMGLAGGSIADDETSYGAFLNHDNATRGGLDGVGDGQIARVDYSFSGITASISAEQVANGATVANAGETAFGIGLAYSGDLGGTTITAGVGYQTLEDVADVTAVGVTAGLASGLSVGANYVTYDSKVAAFSDYTGYNIGVGYTMNALAIGVSYGDINNETANDVSGYGLAVAYDLGGGASVRFGYGLTDVSNVGDADTYSLGLRMAF